MILDAQHDEEKQPGKQCFSIGIEELGPPNRDYIEFYFGEPYEGNPMLPTSPVICCVLFSMYMVAGCFFPTRLIHVPQVIGILMVFPILSLAVVDTPSAAFFVASPVIALFYTIVWKGLACDTIFLLGLAAIFACMGWWFEKTGMKVFFGDFRERLQICSLVLIFLPFCWGQDLGTTFASWLWFTFVGVGGFALSFEIQRPVWFLGLIWLNFVVFLLLETGTQEKLPPLTS